MEAKKNRMVLGARRGSIRHQGEPKSGRVETDRTKRPGCGRSEKRWADWIKREKLRVLTNWQEIIHNQEVCVGKKNKKN